MLKLTTSENDMKDISKTMNEFNMQLDRQNLINEQITDMMGDEDEMEDDTEIDNIIEQEQASLSKANQNMNFNQNPNNQAFNDLENKLAM